MDAAGITARIVARFGELTVTGSDLSCLDPYVFVATPYVGPVAAFLKREPELSFDSLQCLSAVDYKEHMEVVYHLFSMRHRHKFVFKAKLTRENPRVATVEGVWRGANWHEREAYDMMGIVFEGHSDPRRILCPDDWEGWPLRKDYEQPEFYNGMRVKPTEQMVEEAKRLSGGVGGYGRGPFE
jgi:NADH-quinone oxidoreductase subunit C